MELKLLNKEELTTLYQTRMTDDFPKSELKPLRAMLGLMDMGRYDPLLATEGGRAVGYAMAWLPEGRKGALLEYFGVMPELRSGGLGGRILELLAARYGQLFGEAEATVAAATDTTLVVLVPENEPGDVKVAVIVGELTSNTLKFIYEVPVVEAKVTAIEPTHASVGDKVTLKGEGFGESKEEYMVLFYETEAVIER